MFSPRRPKGGGEKAEEQPPEAEKASEAKETSVDSPQEEEEIALVRKEREKEEKQKENENRKRFASGQRQNHPDDDENNNLQHELEDGKNFANWKENRVSFRRISFKLALLARNMRKTINQTTRFLLRPKIND